MGDVFPNLAAGGRAGPARIAAAGASALPRLPTLPLAATSHRHFRPSAGLARLLLAALAIAALPGGEAAAQAFSLPPVSAPSGADTWVVERIEFEGHRVFTTAELEALAAPFLKRPLRRLDLEELRQRITRAYVDRGYISSGALLVADGSRGGAARLRIIEGEVAELRVKGAGRLDSGYLGARLLRSGEALDVHRLEQRFRLLLADPLFDRVNVRLLPGEALGRSVLDVEVVRARPWQIAVFANNQLAPAVGSHAVGVDGQVRNLTGWGDTLAASVSRHGRQGGTSAEASFTLPVAAGLTWVQVRLARGATSVVEEPLSALGIESNVRTREFTVGHPLVDRTDMRFTLGLTVADRRNRTTLDGQPFSFVAGEPSGVTELQALRFFQDLVLRFDRHAVALRSTFVSGQNNLSAEPLVQGQPARDYRLWVGQAQAALATGEPGRQWLLRATVQRSADRLVPLEQFSVGGRHTVRGYRENTLVRDRGWTLGAEFHQPLVGGEGASRRLVLVPFVDAGRAADRGGPAARLASAGVGLQWQFDGIEGELFYARRIEKRPADTHGDLQDRGIHFSLRWRPL